MPRFDLLDSHGQDRHFVVEVDNDGKAHLRFGDGDLGQMPAACTIFKAHYRTGNGPVGNIGAETITNFWLRNGSLSGAALHPRNPLPAQGGTAPEPVTEVKLFAPGAFRKQLRRAVTADDYAQLAEASTTLQRAGANLRWTGSWYEARVAVDPLGSEETDRKLLRKVTGALYRYRRIGHDLKVVKAQYVALDIELTVCVLPHYLRGHVEAALLDVFSTRVLPDGTLGFFHPDNLTFGEGVYLSQLVAAAQAVAGVESARVTRLQRYGEPPNGEKEGGVLPLGPLQVAQLDNDPSFPEHGRLSLVMGGGR
jgi:predicted phage baseplate assembly protein